MDPNSIRQRLDALMSQRHNVEQTWDVITQFVAPFKGDFFATNQNESAIEWRQRQIFDATAVQAHIQLASSLHGAATNPAIRWFDLAWRDKTLRDNHAARVWLENAATRTYEEMQDSNFNLEVNTAYRNLTSFGTAFLVQEPVRDFTQGWGGMEFSNVPLKQGYFEPDARGGARCFFRLMRWKPSKIKALCETRGVECPRVVAQKLEAGSDEQIAVVFAVYPNPAAGDRAARVLTPEKRPYQYVYMLYDNKEVFDRGGYYEMPVTVPRWEVTDESVWGHSPAHYALADILTLNQLVELDIKSREKVIDPALLAEERALLADLDLGPGQVNVVRSVDGVRPFESAARFDAVESSIIRLQMAIQRYFYIDQLELKESPAMTATEVQVRYELMQRLLASTMSRIKEDMLDPVVQRTFNMLWRAGEFETPPDGVEVGEYDIHYVGPLSRSMRFDQAASIERWITQLQMIAQAGGPEAEDVLLVPDFEKIARHAAVQLNIPTELTRDTEDVASDREARQAQRSEQAQAETNRNNAAAVRDLKQARDLEQTGDPSIV